MIPDILSKPLKDRPVLFYILWVVLLFASGLLALTLGTIPISIQDVFRAIAFEIGIEEAQLSSIQSRALWQIRMPRILMALITGGGLSIIGVAMQTLVRNPLAEPYILGISSGAAAGASLYYLGFLPAFLSTSLNLSLSAFVGCVITIMIVYAVARVDGYLSVYRLLLAGVAMSALMGAINTFVLYASPDLEQMKSLMFWLLGSFSSSQWSSLGIPAVTVATAYVVLMLMASPLDAMLLGDEPAANLGLSVDRLKAILILLTALVTGSLVAAVGAIGFVGLIIPHSVRFFTGPSHQKLLPITFMAGAVFMIWADTVARNLIEHAELPIGVVTALCGVPFFLFLLRGYKETRS